PTAATRRGGDDDENFHERTCGARRYAACRLRARRRRHLRAPAQSRAAELAHEPWRLQRAPLFSAGADQQDERQDPALCIFGRAWPEKRQRTPARHTARRRRLYVY